MSPLLQSVASGLRRELAKSTGTFLVELEGRIRQLLGNMVDGQDLSPLEAEALRVHILDIVRREALPRLHQKPGDALRILDLLVAYGYPQLESERPRVEAARAAQFPAPAMLDTPEIAHLLALSRERGSGCVAHEPSGNAYFAERLRRDKLVLPAELVAAYAAFDGFELTCASAPLVPVFSLLPSTALDIVEGDADYPRRVLAFQGGDCVDLGVGSDRNADYWLVFEHDGVPIAKRRFDLRALFAFALARRAAVNLDELDGELSWDGFFDAGI
jgi:hypothetical protein